MIFFLLSAPQTSKNEKDVLSPNSQYIYAYNSILSVTDIRKMEMEEIVRSKALANHINADLLIKVAKCESGLNPEAKNPSSTASGLFQFLTSTFISQAEAHGLEWTDKNDPGTQAELAAEMIANGGLVHWKASESCWGGV